MIDIRRDAGADTISVDRPFAPSRVMAVLVDNVVRLTRIEAIMRTDRHGWFECLIRMRPLGLRLDVEGGGRCLKKSHVAVRRRSKAVTVLRMPAANSPQPEVPVIAVLRVWRTPPDM